MNFFKKRRAKLLLKDCDYIQACSLLTNKFKGAVIPKELSYLLDSFLDKPGFDTAINLIDFDSEFLAFFTFCELDTFFNFFEQ